MSEEVKKPQEAVEEEAELQPEKELSQEAEQAENGASQDGPKEEHAEHHGKHEKLKEELAKAQAETADYKDKWMRSVAEFDNFRKRNEAARRNAYLDGKGDILLKIFPIGDNLERALLSCDEQTKKGIEMVLRSFKKLLEDEGIEEINPVDEEFDPAFCEAIMSEPAADGVEAGYVKEVFLKGYKRGDKVLRFAQVKVTS